MRALPSTFRADAEAAAGATVVDPVPWGDRDRNRPPHLDVLQAAVVRGRRVRLVYQGRSRERTERVVDPWGLVDKDDVWYSATWAAVLIDRRFVPVLHDRFGRHLVDDGDAPDGRARVRVAAPTPLDLARQLAGWGGLVEVEGPDAVRERLAAIGAELVERYVTRPTTSPRRPPRARREP